MYWGYSPALDFQQELMKDDSEEPINILIIGSSDARHVLKTTSSLHLYNPKRKINFHIIENSLEEIGRCIFLLSICFEEGLGLQEATKYYLEILGNTRLRPATAKYIISRMKTLIDVLTDTKKCDWLNLNELKYKHKDALEQLYKFWSLGASENISTSKIWDLKVRRLLGTRYDYKTGAFDWDYHMILKPRGIKNLSAHDYIFWRENGIAFVWIEGEPIRNNSTFVTLTQHMLPFFMGDVRNGPFFTWINDSTENDKNQRIADINEKQVMSAIYEVHNKEKMDDEKYAAHRDNSLVNGTIVITLDDQSLQQESWSSSYSRKKIDVNWIDLPQIMVTFYEITVLNKMKHKSENKFDCIWIAEKVSKEHRNIYNLLKNDGILLTETRQFLVDYKDDEVKQFKEELKEDAIKNGLKLIEQENNFKAVLSFQK